MSSDEVRFAEAVASLTARLEAWGVEDPAAKAQEYVADMRRNGWRPRALPVHAPPMPIPTAPPADVLAQMREQIAAARARMTDHDPRRAPTPVGTTTEET